MIQGIQQFCWQVSLKFGKSEGLFFASMPGVFICHYMVCELLPSGQKLLYINHQTPQMTLCSYMTIQMIVHCNRFLLPYIQNILCSFSTDNMSLISPTYKEFMKYEHHGRNKMLEKHRSPRGLDHPLQSALPP